MKSFFEKAIFLQTINSTNTYLKKNDHKDRTIVYSFNQKEGRGRAEKKWSDFNEKNLALSIMLKGAGPVFDSVWYTAACSLAFTDSLISLGVRRSWIKWPNDIYIKNKKIAGVLTESVWRSNSIEKIIIGIGVNVNTDINDLGKLDNKATSVFLETKQKQELDTFVNGFIRYLDKWFTMLIEDQKIDVVKDHWLKRCRIIGKKVKFTFNNETYIGKVKNINRDGELEVRSGKDKFEVLSGDVLLI